MEEDSVVQTEAIFESVSQYFNTLISDLSRPVVLRQLMAIGLILTLAWLISWLFRKWTQRRLPESATHENGSKLGMFINQLDNFLSPIITLILLYITVWIFSLRGYPYGLLQSVQLLFWVWLIYSGVVLVLYTRFGETVQPYRRRLLVPIFVTFIIWQIISIIPGFQAFTTQPITLGSLSLTIIAILESVVVLYLFFVTGWIIEEIINQNLPRRLQAGPGVVQSISRIIRYGISALGIVLAFAILGLDATSLAIVAGGLSVGIGIGLQDIVADFVSGLVLLFEQSLRPGDFVEMDGKISQVDEISLRSTRVRTLNNEEIIIPNANLTRYKFTTLTKTNRRVRIALPVGVSYRSNPDQVRALLEELALEHPLVLRNPAPRLVFKELGPSGLNFELLVWVDYPEESAIVKSDLYYKVFSELTKQGIEIPYPQRDIHLRSGWEKLTPTKQPSE